MYYCCSINLKRLSEHSGLRPDTSSLVSITIKTSAIYRLPKVLLLFEREVTKISYHANF